MVRVNADLSSLLPCAIKTDQTAERTGQTDDTVVEVEEAETAGGNSQIAQVGDELELGGALVPVVMSLAIRTSFLRYQTKHTWQASLLQQPSLHPRFPPASSLRPSGCKAHTRLQQRCTPDRRPKHGTPPSAT